MITKLKHTAWMKCRLAVFLLLFAPVAGTFAAYTEFYCQSGGSNLNAGSTNNNTAAYTSIHGNWTTTGNVFTVTDGTNPSSSVNVGDWASVYADSATSSTCTLRVSAVQNAVNGTITCAGATVGSVPGSGTGTRSIKVGGAWKGPNGNDLAPLSYVNLGNGNDSSGHWPRYNLKNDQTYLTSSAPTLTGTGFVLQGYSSSVGDGGRATIDTGTNLIDGLIASGSNSQQHYIDLIITSSATGGTNIGFNTGTNGTPGCLLFRVTVKGFRGAGIDFTGGIGNSAVETEVNNCNKSNTSGKAGLILGPQGLLRRVVVSGNTGSNNDGVLIGGTVATYYIEQLVSFGNGRHGLAITGSSSTTSWQHIVLSDFYNNGADGIKLLNTTQNYYYLAIENCNFVKNAGYGINSALTTGKWQGYIINPAFGSGTQANGNGTTNNIDNLQTIGTTTTYTANTTPWTDPTNGNFTLTPAGQAVAAGRGNFTETQGGYSGTNSYTDLGAAQAPSPTATATSTATPTATATSTATATDTPTPTATATASFTPCFATPTATATFTPSATSTPTNTPTPTATATASFTPCAETPTPTPTWTPTATSTPTSTSTPTPTSTPTSTSTPTPTVPPETSHILSF